MKLEVRPNKEGLLTIECLELEKWRDGDKLVRYLKRNLGARVKDKVAGPDSRRWFLSVGGKEVSVDQWDWGFLSISALNKSDETIIPDIAEHLRQISIV